jgi:hypothetical protein
MTGAQERRRLAPTPSSCDAAPSCPHGQFRTFLRELSLCRRTPRTVERVNEPRAAPARIAALAGLRLLSPEQASFFVVKDRAVLQAGRWSSVPRRRRWRVHSRPWLRQRRRKIYARSVAPSLSSINRRADGDGQPSNTADSCVKRYVKHPFFTERMNRAASVAQLGARAGARGSPLCRAASALQRATSNAERASGGVSAGVLWTCSSTGGWPVTESHAPAATVR